MAEFMSGSVRLDELLHLPDDEELKLVVRDCSLTSTSSTYSSVVYLSRHLMTRHEISYGDPKVLQGSGGRQTACTVIPDLQEEYNEDFSYQIRLNSAIQDQLGVDVGDLVDLLNSEKVMHGKVVWIRPVRPVRESFVDFETENLLETYLLPYFWRAYRLVCEGDVFKVTRSGKMIEFQVTKTDPSSFCVVAPGTTIRCGKIVPEIESMAAGKLPLPKEGVKFKLLLKTGTFTSTKRAEIKSSSSSKKRRRVIDRNTMPSFVPTAGQRSNTLSYTIKRDTEAETSNKFPALPEIMTTPRENEPGPPVASLNIETTQSRLAKFIATTVKGIGNCLAQSTPIKSCATNRVHLDAGDYTYSSNLIASGIQEKKETAEHQSTSKTNTHQLLKLKKPVQNAEAESSSKSPAKMPVVNTCTTLSNENNNCGILSNMIVSSATNINKCNATSSAHDRGATDQLKAGVSSVLLAEVPKPEPVSVRKPLLETLKTVDSSSNNDGFISGKRNISNICQSKVQSTKHEIQKVLPRELIGCSEHLNSTNADVSDTVKKSTECKQRIINSSAVDVKNIEDKLVLGRPAAAGVKYPYQIQQKDLLPPQPERINESYQPYRIPRKIQPAPPIIAPIPQLVEAQQFRQATHRPQHAPLNPGTKPWNPPVWVVEPLPHGIITRMLICPLCTKRNVRGNLRHRHQQCPHRRISNYQYLQLLQGNGLCPRCRGNPNRRHPMPGVCPWAAMLDGNGQ